MILFHTGSKCRKCCLTLFTAWISKIRLVSFVLTSSRTECELLKEGNSDTHKKLWEENNPGFQEDRLLQSSYLWGIHSAGFLWTMTWLYVFIYIFWRVHRMLPWGMLQLSRIPFYIYTTNNSAYRLTWCSLTISNYGGAFNGLSQVFK